MNLSRNKLTAFPDPLFDLEHLNILDLSNNNIEDLDVDRIYQSFPELTQLNLAGNPIPEDVKKLLSNSEKKPKLLNLILE